MGLGRIVLKALPYVIPVGLVSLAGVAARIVFLIDEGSPRFPSFLAYVWIAVCVVMILTAHLRAVRRHPGPIPAGWASWKGQGETPALPDWASPNQAFEIRVQEELTAAVQRATIAHEAPADGSLGVPSVRSVKLEIARSSEEVVESLSSKGFVLLSNDDLNQPSRHDSVIDLDASPSSSSMRNNVQERQRLQDMLSKMNFKPVEFSSEQMISAPVLAIAAPIAAPIAAAATLAGAGSSIAAGPAGIASLPTASSTPKMSAQEMLRAMGIDPSKLQMARPDDMPKVMTRTVIDTTPAAPVSRHHQPSIELSSIRVDDHKHHSDCDDCDDADDRTALLQPQSQQPPMMLRQSLRVSTCAQCNIIQPPRTYHCKRCNTFVFYCDHTNTHTNSPWFFFPLPSSNLLQMRVPT